MTDALRVLAIDDDAGVLEYLDALMTRQGYEVRLATSGEQALSEIERFHPDLVTLDVVLDGMDGLETLRQIKKRLPEAAVIMLSGHGHAHTIVEAIQLGASDFLRKPFEVEELELAFRKALETQALRQEVSELRGLARNPFERLISGADDGKMREIREITEQVADTDITVLIRGESGTGKELIARTLHQLSSRRDKPFVKVNCAALPSELLESELFGFEKGAFTGAQKRKLGKFEFANAGTIFLDEIGEMSPALQAKLLQVLQDGEFSRLGGTADVRVDTRVLAATHKNLEEAVERGEFREDLYYRLNVVTIQLPPLRERVGAISMLIDHFLKKFNAEYHRDITAFSPKTMAALEAYAWPGNVRELQNLVRRMIVLGNEDVIVREIAQKSPSAGDPQGASSGLDGVIGMEALSRSLQNGEVLDLKAISRRAARMAEERVIAKVLDATRWNRKEAAARLQISYKALLYKMKECGLTERP